MPDQAREELESAAPEGADGERVDDGRDHEGDYERPQFDPEIEARRRAALSRVRTFGDPALRSRAADVTVFDDTLEQEVQRMTRLMSDALGVGLAATQLGVMHRMLVYRVGVDAPVVVVVNPTLEWSSNEQEVAEEACLSLPGIALDIERPLYVRITARDQHGEPIMVEASGLEARVIQHEMDHLDGVLILDHAEREQRREAMRLLRGGEPRETAETAETADTSEAA